MRRLKVKSLIGVMLGVVILLPVAGFAQTLDEAVAYQLEVVVDGGARVPCFRLMGTTTDRQDFLNALGDGLHDICKRGGGSGGPGGPSALSSGGGAGTPTSLSGIVKARMEREEEADEDSAVMALNSRLSLFVSGEYEELDRKVTTFEDGYDSDIWRLAAGLDLLATERLVVGIALSTSRKNGDFNGGGNFENESYGIVAFGSFLPTNDTFVQISGGYTISSNERKRFATFTDENEDIWPKDVYPARPTADFDVDQYSAGILTGYDYSLRGFTVGPRIGIDWTKTKFETYSEGGGDSGLELIFYDNDATSLQSSVGLGGSFATSTDFGVVTMQGGLDWKHEFDQDQRNIEVSFVDDLRENPKRFTYETEEPDRDFFELNAGVSVVLPNGMQGFVNFRTLLGHSYFDSYAGTIGMRIKL